MGQKKDAYDWQERGKECLKLVWTASGDSLAPESVSCWHTFTGLPAEAIPDWGWLTALHPEDREAVRQSWARAEKTRCLSLNSYRVASPDGFYQRVTVKRLPILHGDSSLKEWICWLAEGDPQTEQATMTGMEHIGSQAPYHLIFEKASIAMLYLSLDGFILEANEQYRNLTGYTNDELRELAFLDFIHPDAVNPGFLFQHELLTGKVQPRVSEKRISCQDGKSVWLKVSTTLLQLPSMEPLCFSSQVEDITHHKKGNVTIHKPEESHIKDLLTTFLTLVEDLMQIPEQVVEAQYARTFQPSCILTTIGPRLAELIGQVIECKHVRVMTRLEEAGDALESIGTYNRSREDAAYDQTEGEQLAFSEYLDAASLARIKANDIIVQDLKEQQFSPTMGSGLQKILMAPLCFDRQVVGLITVDKAQHDLAYTVEEIALVRVIAKLLVLIMEHVHILNEWTMTRTNELALQETNCRFDAFISLASHELKTPLTTIKGNVQLAQRRLETLIYQLFPTLSDEQRQAWERIKQPLQYAVQRVSVQDRMISDLLDVSRIKANRLELIMHPCDLVEIVQHSVEDQFILASDRTINVEMAAEKPIPILADMDRISQVIANYLGNALKYSSSTQPVTLTLTVEGMQARVAVQDRGPGLSYEDQQHVWERFYRVPGIEVRYGSGSGMGLGLHLCQTIITQHCGQIGLESVPGKGSTFWFTLPISGPVIAL